MSIRIAITFDGDVRGLAQHRLSLQAFGPALVELARAFRRTASNILTSAAEDDVATGRLHRQAECIDLELTEVKPGSTMPVFDVTFVQGGQQPLIADIVERAAIRFLEDVEGEASGQPRSSVVRKFLAKLPDGVTHQNYAVLDGNRVLKTVSFGTPRLPTLPPDLPRLTYVTGTIAALGFVEGASFVDIAIEGGRSVESAASLAQVETALQLRGETVQALILEGARSRLMWIRSAATRFEPLPPDARTERIHKDWSETLAALAR